MINIEEYSSILVKDNGIYFTNKQSKISYPESGNQDCFQMEDDSFWFKHRNKCILEIVKKHCLNNCFFDIGGGNGFVSKELQNNGIETVLVEPGIQGCLNANKRGIKNIICSTLENIEFKKNAIPTIGLFDVVEHIENDDEFLKEIFSYIKTDGYVVLTVPAYKALWSNEDIDAGHYRRYSLKEIEKKLTNIGFEIIQSTYIFSILPIPVFFFRTLPSKIGLNKNSNNLSKLKEEHNQKKGILSAILDKVWNAEIKNIKNNTKIPFGGSCLVVARKK